MGRGHFELFFFMTTTHRQDSARAAEAEAGLRMTLVFYDDGERKYRAVVDTMAVVYCTHYRGGEKSLDFR